MPLADKLFSTDVATASRPPRLERWAPWLTAAPRDDVGAVWIPVSELLIAIARSGLQEVIVATSGVWRHHLLQPVCRSPCDTVGNGTTANQGGENSLVQRLTADTPASRTIHTHTQRDTHATSGGALLNQG